MSDSRQAPLVAIVTPVYNGARFLTETLDCVQAQSYENVVHVVLNNASTDGTASILSQFNGDRHPVSVHRNDHTIPLKENWEKAIRLSPDDAKYFLLLCADDTISPDCIERLVQVAELDNAIGVVGCWWTSGQSPEEATLCRKGLPEQLSVFDGQWFVKAYLSQLHFGTSPQCQLFRRALIGDEPFYANEELLIDIDACIRVALKGKVGFVHKALGFTRVHGGRVTDTITAPQRMFEAIWLFLIDRYGSSVMSPEELKKCRSAYLRYYWRQLLIWRFKDGDRALFERHMALLKQRRSEPNIWRFALAGVDWGKFALMNRRNEVGTSRSLWRAVWQELKDIDNGPARLSVRQL